MTLLKYWSQRDAKTSGIHFRYDSEEGHQLGAKIGEYASREFMKPVE
ncbi:hypothetical protein AAOE16_02215 [Ekhidna sp. MALMAid0563]